MVQAAFLNHHDLLRLLLDYKLLLLDYDLIRLLRDYKVLFLLVRFNNDRVLNGSLRVVLLAIIVEHVRPFLVLVDLLATIQSAADLAATVDKVAIFIPLLRFKIVRVNG